MLKALSARLKLLLRSRQKRSVGLSCFFIVLILLVFCSTSSSTTSQTSKTKPGESVKQKDSIKPTPILSQETSSTQTATSQKKRVNLVQSNLEISAKNIKKESRFDIDEVKNANYANLISNKGDSFVDLSLEEKCEMYFNELYETDSDWKIRPFKEPTTDASLAQIINNMKHLNIFLHCYSSEESELPNSAGWSDIDKRVFPYLSFQMPEYTRWTGETTIGPPDMSLYKDDQSLSVKEYRPSKTSKDLKQPEIPSTKSFASYYKSQINGKGIVISASDIFINDTVTLIRNLRTVGNTLPIQLIHRGDLSIESQKLIVGEARRENIYYPASLFAKLKSMKHKDFDPTFPKQDLWFVDISSSLSSDFKNDFVKFYNKLLAYLFTSFEEIIILDNDVALFRNPSNFFKSSQYKESGSLFFKDRNLIPQVNDGFIDFIKDILPTKLDTKFFGINPTTYKTLGIKYMTLSYGHLMESGVVAINRSSFWKGIFITLHLSQIRPIHENVWGDKELFWLGQSISGNEDYRFNDYWAASVGQLTPSERRQQFKSRELCSTHPGHISSDTNELLWVNSGLQTCRRADTFEIDFDQYEATLGFGTKEELRDFYESTLKIESAIIPPDSMYWVDYLDTPREPRQGFIKQYNCAAYWWCAYDKIGGSDFPEHQGQVFNFTPEDVVFFDYVGSVYIGN